MPVHTSLLPLTIETEQTTPPRRVGVSKKISVVGFVFACLALIGCAWMVVPTASTNESAHHVAFSPSIVGAPGMRAIINPRLNTRNQAQPGMRAVPSPHQTTPGAVRMSIPQTSRGSSGFMSAKMSAGEGAMEQKNAYLDQWSQVADSYLEQKTEYQDAQLQTMQSEETYMVAENAHLKDELRYAWGGSLVCAFMAFGALAIAGRKSLFSQQPAAHSVAMKASAGQTGDASDTVGTPGAPHGGKLVDTFESDEAKRDALIASCTATLELSERQTCDVQLLVNGGFSPLDGFMKQADYDGIVDNMRTTNGDLFGLPVVLDVQDESLAGKKVLLKYNGTNVAVLDAEDVWKPNKVKEAASSFGTTSTEHPSVQELFADLGQFYVGGKVTGLTQGFEGIWGAGFKTPADVRASLPADKSVVAFQNRNPVHKAHFELLVAASKDVENSVVLVHPTCGPTQPGDIDGATRIKTYEVLQEEPTYKKWVGDTFRWSYLPYSMKMAGPREAIQHMIIRKNFGATHFIVGRDMAGTKSTLDGEDFYGPFDAQEIGKKHSAELAVTVVDYPNMVYVGEEHGNERGFVTEQEAKDKGLKPGKLSGTAFRDALRSGDEIPEWFAFPKVVEALRAGEDIFIK
jgi:sulfate adenylyltransferase